jgi:acyl carrier protein
MRSGEWNLSMTKQEQVFEVLAKVSRKDRALIKPESELAADLGIDSPRALQLLMELEEKLNIEIGEEDAARMNTVKDILMYVEKK